MALTRDTLLDGVRVAELATERAGPYASRLLASLGASVVKVESPGTGDPGRRLGPFVRGAGGKEESLTFYYLNFGKRGICLDISTASGRDVFLQLLATMDILISDHSGQEMQRLGLGYAELCANFPKLVIIAIRPFGLDGPWADHHARALNIYHASGLGYITRRRNEQGDIGPPMRAAGYQADYFAAIHGAAAAVGGLFHQRLSGSGQLIELSQQELLLALIYNPLAYYYYEQRVIGEGPQPQQAGGILPCKDGYVLLGSNEEHFGVTLIDLLGNPDWSEGGWWKDAESRFMNRDFLNGKLVEWLSELTMREFNEVCQARHLPVAVLNTPKDVGEHVQLKGRGFFEDWDDRDLGKVRFPGIPFRLSEHEQPIGSDAPRLGEHSAEVLQELGLKPSDISVLHQRGVV